MLRSILDLADVTVVEVMTHRRQMVTIDAELPAAEIVDSALASPYSRLPLWRGEPDNIVGVVHAKSLLRAVRAARGKMEALNIEKVASKPWFVPDTTTLLDQLEAFRDRREHFALVVDEYGSLQGLVTLEDILEEIVGDITDELDTHVAGVFPQADGGYIVNGTVTVRDLNREFDWELPDETDYSTIAGLVIYESRHVPEVGQTFTFFGFRFEILQRQRNQIVTLRLTPPGVGQAPPG
jgi:Mg2+/Co2+ transporter CorB